MQVHKQGWQIFVLTRGVWSVGETSTPLRSHVRRCVPSCPQRPQSYPFGAVKAILLVPEIHLLERWAGPSSWLGYHSEREKRQKMGGQEKTSTSGRHGKEDAGAVWKLLRSSKRSKGEEGPQCWRGGIKGECWLYVIGFLEGQFYLTD